MMEPRLNIALVDTDFRRRAAITHGLSGRNVHVEPFEAIDEILSRWPSSGVILLEDQSSSIEQLITAMTETGQWLPLVGMAQNAQTFRVVSAVRRGAADYIDWPCTPDDLLAILLEARASDSSLGTLKLREARARSKLHKLTRREREVLTAVANGMSNRLIGQSLAISPRTVEIHRANVLHKIGASHTSEAIRIAIEASLVA
jgi:two-component system, LuxR family, response regulator FixJ